MKKIGEIIEELMCYNIRAGDLTLGVYREFCIQKNSKSEIAKTFARSLPEAMERLYGCEYYECIPYTYKCN